MNSNPVYKDDFMTALSDTQIAEYIFQKIQAEYQSQDTRTVFEHFQVQHQNGITKIDGRIITRAENIELTVVVYFGLRELGLIPKKTVVNITTLTPAQRRK